MILRQQNFPLEQSVVATPQVPCPSPRSTGLRVHSANALLGSPGPLETEPGTCLPSQDPKLLITPPPQTLSSLGFFRISPRISPRLLLNHFCKSFRLSTSPGAGLLFFSPHTVSVGDSPRVHDRVSTCVSIYLAL